MMTLDDASVGRLSVSWSRRSGWHPAVLSALVGVAVLLETAVLELDHGTHLLVGLAAVLTTVLLLGPKPALVGLALGAGVAAAASLATGDAASRLPSAYIQLTAYLFVGAVSIWLVDLAVRARTPPSADGSNHPALHDWTPVAVRRLAEPALAQPPTETLTPRELEILRLATTGVTVEEMARRLCVSPNTVKTHLTHLYAKLGVRGRTDAVRAALHAGCLTPADICPHQFGRGPSESPVPVTTPDAVTPTI